MPAFNRRFQPKEIWGIPLWAGVAFLGFFLCTALSLMVPLIIKLLTIPLAIFSFVSLVGLLWIGDEIQFISVMWLSRFVDNNRVTSETGTKY